MITIFIGKEPFETNEEEILRVAAKHIEVEVTRSADEEFRAFVSAELQDEEFLAAVSPYLSQEARSRITSAKATK